MHACSIKSNYLQPVDCSQSGSSVHGIFQARILKWVAISYSRDLPNPGIEPTSLASPVLAGGFFTTLPPGKPIKYVNPTLKYKAAGDQVLKKLTIIPLRAQRGSMSRNKSGYQALVFERWLINWWILRVGGGSLALKNLPIQKRNLQSTKHAGWTVHSDFMYTVNQGRATDIERGRVWIR